MSSIRQNKLESVIQEEVASFLLVHSRDLCLGAMVSVTIVRVSPDMSYSKIYLSIFGHKDKEKVLENIQQHASKIKGTLGKRLKNLRKIPSLNFFIDDSIDYAEKIDQLLSKK
ncbi:MAG: 30S ribosome-binding factor RbfA [Flavobacteriia bacterium]|nr:30S ribosome-binding factor RbfA [Flavobacteriia bacterium]